MKDKTMYSPKTLEPIPKGFHTVTPFIVARNATGLLEFLKKAFNGETTSIMHDPDGKVMHATARIGNSIVMVSDANDRFPAMPAMLYLYMDDVDLVFNKAIKAGGQSLREPTNEFYGDRSAGIKDAWDNQWWIATHIEDVDEKELKRRADEFRKQ
jgi:PhnB protein